MSDNPVVSVIMTVYNGEQYIKGAIDCIRNQTFTNWEMVIVDDGSQDSTAQVLSEVAAVDSRIRIVASERFGRAKALNVAWQNASGQYIANLDVDDLSRPERLAKQVELLKTRPEVGMVSTDVLTITYDYNGKERRRDERVLPTDSDTLKHMLIHTCPIIHSSVMMQRTALEKVGGYNESYRVAIDYELWTRIGQQYELANISEFLTVLHLHTKRYFHTEISPWQRARANYNVRWQAWRSFSGNILDLWYVFADPAISVIRKTVSRQTRRIYHNLRETVGAE